MNIKVSVIIPSLNVADYIRECIESVLNQSLKEMEIICVDAGSTDGTREILGDYAGKDTRIVILDSDVKSYGRQVNMGLEYASGEYIAVLESDDWIEANMYQCLYEHAAMDSLDYIAADFDTFYELQSGQYYYSRQRIFPVEKQKWYGETLDSEQIATLRASDYVLWRGIYDRKFLMKYKIRLHESSGASFQDMGFLQQVKTYAKTAKYIDRSFYRYRQDRETASSVSSEGLKFYEREFQWLNNNQRLMSVLDGNHKKYYYFTMCISFITKYEQVLSLLEGDWQDERLSVSYEWFKGQLLEAVENGLLERRLYGKELWDRMSLLLTSPKEHATQLINNRKKREEPIKELRQMTKGRPVVIFGCGNRGERLMLFCDRNKIEISSFCDNDTTLQGKKRFGFPILSPKELKEEIYIMNEMVLLSMKEGTEQVYEQLVGLGIGVDRIINIMPGWII